jgi:hypothetical protein
MEGRKAGKVLVDKKKKQALILGASRWPTTTLTMCVSAAGRAALTRVLVGGTKPPPGFDELDPKFFELKMQPKGGWQTAESFADYIRTRCLKEIVAARLPRDGPNARSLLILDSHPSRRNPELWRECASNNIDVLTIPAHTSHLLQPLDRGINAAYKKKLAEEYERPCIPGVDAHRTALAAALLPAVQFALQAGTIRAAWRTAGIEPFDPITTTAHLPITFGKAAAPAGFNISSELLTDPPFLKKWDEYLKKSPQKTRKKKEETMAHSNDVDQSATPIRPLKLPRRAQPPTRTEAQTETDEVFSTMKKEKTKLPPPLTEDEVIRMEEDLENRPMDDECHSEDSDGFIITQRSKRLRIIRDDDTKKKSDSYRICSKRIHREVHVDDGQISDLTQLRRSSRTAARIPLLSGCIQMDEEKDMEIDTYLEFFQSAQHITRKM